MKSLIALCLIAILAELAAAQDTTVVRSQGAPVWRNPHLIEDLRIGVLEGDDRYIFGQISDMEVTTDGSIWVVDGQGPRVRIYDRNGRFVRAVYKPGSGPGEIKSVTGIAPTPHAQIAIWDIDNSRVSLYRENGEHVGGFRVMGNRLDSNLTVDRTGAFWVFTSILNPACMRHVSAPDGSVREISSGGLGCARNAYLRFSPSGEVKDTAFVPVPEQQPNIGFVVFTPEGLLLPFAPQWHYALSPLGRFVTAFSTPYAFNLVDATRRNAAVTRIERSYKPLKLSSAEKAEWDARREYAARRQPNLSSDFKVPDTKPAIRSISVADDGRIWINRYVEAVKRSDISSTPTRAGGPPGITWREPATFDVFDPTGRFLGTIVAPRGVRFLVQRGLNIWGVLRGELDENYVVRYRIETN